MKAERLTHVLLIFGAIVVTTCARAAAPDLSSPKAAAKSFYAAVEAGDAAAMRDMIGADDADHQKLAQAFADVIAAGKKLADVARDKYGAAGDPIGRGSITREDAAKIDSATVEENGDDATLTIPGQQTPIKLHRTSGAWKLDIRSFHGARAEELPAQITLVSNMAAALTEAADEINTGKYATATEAESAIQQKLNEVMIKAVKPATQPTSQPTTKPAS